MSLFHGRLSLDITESQTCGKPMGTVEQPRGEEGYERWVELGIVSTNLIELARKLAVT